MADRCNAHGVYEPDEVLRLPRDNKGWRGMDTASIELRDLGTHWIYAADYMLLDGDCCGHGEPLSDTHPCARRAPSRGAAIDAAIEKLRTAMAPRAQAGGRDARRILAWLDDLRPARASLFGEAA